MERFLSPDWRLSPAAYDIPANSQILGQRIAAAGVQAIFPQNLEESNSFLKLDDPAPHPTVPVEINHQNWRLCELTYDDFSVDNQILINHA